MGSLPLHNNAIRATNATQSPVDSASISSANPQRNRSVLFENTRKWGELTEKGEYDRVISHAKAHFSFQSGQRPTALQAYSGVYIAQAYLQKGVFDSTQVYLNAIQPAIAVMQKDLTWQTIYYNLSALYFIKAELNYPEAIICFKKALQMARQRKSPINETILLCNIACMYYMRKDTSGMSYAQEAYQISRSTESAYAQCFASVYMGMLSLLCNNDSLAYKHLKEAEGLSDKHRLDYMKSQIYLLYGKFFGKNKQEARAEAYYQKALKHIHVASPEVMIELYCSYGELLFAMHRYQEAEEAYKKGLSVSEKHHDREQLHTLLFGLGELYKQTAQKDSAIKYYSLYHAAQDSSISSVRNERKISLIEQSIKENRYKKQIDQQERTLIKVNRYVYLSVFVAFIILVLSCFVWVRHRRKNREYNLLSEKMKEDESAATAEKDKASEYEKNRGNELYKRLEELIHKEKIYRQNDISLEKMAEILETNRSYVSKLINTHTGMNFYNFINTLRIDEAMTTLSDPENDIPLKVLSDHLGYNTLAVFYRAFQKQAGTPPSKYRAQFRQAEEEKPEERRHTD